MAGIQLPVGIDTVNPVPADFKYGPYANAAAAIAAIPLALRYDGLTVQLTGLGNYWWEASDLTNLGLKEKTPTFASTPITYAALSALISGSLATPGTIYKITDRADLGIYIQAISTDKLDDTGSGSFLNPDYQNIYGNNIGIWWAGISPSIGDVVIYNLLQYESITGAIGTAPSGDATNWQLIPKSILTYINEVDKIIYDFTSDIIKGRFDSRSNFIENGAATFPFGNDNIIFNNVGSNAAVGLNNFRGLFGYNTVNGTVIITSNAGAGYIAYNLISGNSQLTLSGDADFTYNTFTNSILETNNASPINGLFTNIIAISSRITVRTNINQGVDTCIFNNANLKIEVGFALVLTKCTINRNALITIDRDLTFTNKQIDNLGSNFNITLDVSSLFAAGVLTLPLTLNYIGVFVFSGLSGQTISKIINPPLDFKYRVFTASPNTLSYTTAAAASAILNTIIGVTVATTAIVGKTKGSDFIEFERQGILNAAVNIIKFA